MRYTASGKVLDFNGGSSTAGLQLQQWSANGGINQMWYLADLLGVPGASRVDHLPCDPLDIRGALGVIRVELTS